MRIIGGSAKGRRLFTPQADNKAIRPTADRAREALFNIIGSRVKDSYVLDLFAGTGGFGCEALSRGARRVVFVDNSSLSLDLINRNAALIPAGPNRSEAIRYNLSKGFTETLVSRLGKHRFDLIFADPPYLTQLSAGILTSIDKSCVLSNDPLIIIEERKNFNPPEKLDNLHQIDNRRYGVCSFFFYRLNKN